MLLLAHREDPELRVKTRKQIIAKTRGKSSTTSGHDGRAKEIFQSATRGLHRDCRRTTAERESLCPHSRTLAPLSFRRPQGLSLASGRGLLLSTRRMRLSGPAAHESSRDQLLRVCAHRKGHEPHALRYLRQLLSARREAQFFDQLDTAQ